MKSNSHASDYKRGREMNIYEKLSAIQSELFVPKEQKNDFGKYNYRSCEDILKTVKPLAEKHKCVVLLDSRPYEIGGKVYIQAKAKLIDLEGNEHIEVEAFAREEEVKKGMDSSQISGSTLSYARKYALAGLFCIDNEKDSDATNHGEQVQVDQDELVAEAELRTRVTKWANSKDDPTSAIDWVCKTWKVKKLTDLKVEDINGIIKVLTEKGETI